MQQKITPIPEAPEVSYSWSENPAIQKLLDAVSCILANEYVWAAKENPSLFGEIARNDKE